MKVIARDNFARDYISEKLIEDNLTREKADQIAKDHNEKMGDHDPWFYEVVNEDYVLYTWEP